MNRHVVVNILTPSTLESKDQAKRLLQNWLAFAPAYTPDRCGVDEPLRPPFDPTNLDASLSEWNDYSFLLRKRTPRVLGEVFIGTTRGIPTHGWVTIEFDYRPELFDGLQRFFIETSTQFAADFASLHLVPASQRLAITTRRLRQGVPDLYWLTVFGKPYVGLFGRERILTCPQAIVQEHAPELFSIRLSDDIRDVANKPYELAKIAAALKRHLDHNAFFADELGRDYHYTVPDFHIQQ